MTRDEAHRGEHRQAAGAVAKGVTIDLSSLAYAKNYRIGPTGAEKPIRERSGAAIQYADRVGLSMTLMVQLA
jgi:hypothetical protein